MKIGKKIVGPVIGAVIGVGGYGAYQAAHVDTAAVEGGYVNHVDDLGGETNYGVTVEVMRACGFDGDPADFTAAQADACYYERYWAAYPYLDEIGQILGFFQVAQALYDYGVNMGPGNAGKLLQRCLELPVDGVVGSVTLAAVKDYAGAYGPLGGGVLKECLVDEALRHYVRISEGRPQNEAFTFGWIKHRVAADPAPVQNLQRCLNALNDRGRLYPDIVADGSAGLKTKGALMAYLDHRGPAGLPVLNQCTERL